MPLDAWSTQVPYARTRAADFMAAVYRWMAFGLALTGLVAYGIVSSPAALRTVLGNPLLFFGCAIAEVALVWTFSSVLQRASFVTSVGMYLAYCALSGVTFSVYLHFFTGESIATTLFITGGTFAAMSAYGTLTRKDLASWGSFLMMGLIGILIASVVNLFFRSSALQFVLSCAGVVVFTGLTAYDTQKIRALADSGDERVALRGALALYLDFINLFILLLQFFGRRRDD